MGKIYGIIPARSGSKGVVNKNIRKLGGVPLVFWTIVQALKSELDGIILDTDSEKYIELVNEFNIITNLRPPELANDKTLTSEVILNTIRTLNLHPEDHIVLLQPTCPFRSYKMINSTIDLIKNNKDALIISVLDCDGIHPLRMKRIVNGKLINYVDTGFEDMRPRQELPKVYLRSGSIYATSIVEFLKSNSFDIANQIPIIDDPLNTINIDIPRDFQLAELMLEQNMNCINMLIDIKNYLRA